MITLRKLRTLPPDTRLRKIVRMLDGFVYYRSPPDLRYLNGLFDLIQETSPGGLAAPPAIMTGESPEMTLRFIDNLRYDLRSHLGISVGDWDLHPPAGHGAVGPPGSDGLHQSGATNLATGERGSVDGRTQSGVPPPTSPVTVSLYMESIRSPFNAGSIIRSAVALGVTRIGMSPDCPPTNHPRLLRTARGAEQAVKIQRFAFAALPDEWRPLLALEVGGKDVNMFVFPDGGTLLVGSEELGLTNEALEAAQARISVRMTGAKRSMNVGVACGIALHAWYVQAQGKSP